MTLEMAEKKLLGYMGSSDTCSGCPKVESVLDDLMTLRAYEQEISALEDAYDADVDYLLSII